MKKFRYKARDKSGNVVMGEVEAANESVAAKLLRDRGYVVVAINQSMGGLQTMFSTFGNRVSYSDVVAFTRQLATMVNAGLPITECFSILRLQAKPGFQPIITQILADIEGGQSLSNAMKRHPKVFPDSYIALMKAGETGGVLDKVLARLADNMERTQEFRGKVKGALVYPAIVVIGMIGVSLVMVVFVIPRLTDLYSQFGTDLPLSTRLLTGFSDFIIQFWYVIVGILAIVVWSFLLWSKTRAGKIKIAQIMFKTPIIGDLNKQIILTELTRTLSLMVASGVPILEGIAVSADVITNIIISDALKDVGRQIEKGFPIAFSFAKHSEAFPYILSQMVAVGEETGKMDEVLSKISHVFEVESEQKVKALTSAIEPIIMIFLGIGVAFLVFSVVLPIYNLTTSI